MIALVAHQHQPNSVPTTTTVDPAAFSISPSNSTPQVGTDEKEFQMLPSSNSSSAVEATASQSSTSISVLSSANSASVTPLTMPTTAGAVLIMNSPVPQPQQRILIPTPNRGTSNTPILPLGATNSSATPNVASTAVTPGNSPRTSPNTNSPTTSLRLNKFVRRLHDMLQSERNSGIVEWRRGLLVLHSTDAFAKTILPRYFNTRNFKTFRRQLNYYGFVHVRSFSATGSTTTALWVNRDLAKRGTASISSVLMLKRVEPCESAKTAEGRRVRKEQAVSTVEEDIGVSAKSLQLEQIRSMALRREGSLGLEETATFPAATPTVPPIPMVVHCHNFVNSASSDSSKEGLCVPSSPACPPSPASVLPRPPLWSESDDNHKSTTTESEICKYSSANDAANLLLMLSKSVVSSSLSPPSSPRPAQSQPSHLPSVPLSV